MTRRLRNRLGLGAALGLGLLPLLATPAAPPAAQTQTFTGKVVPLADLLAKAGARLDREAGPHWLALACEDGKVYPLVKDSGARMFAQDERLRDRPVRLTGRLLLDGKLLQVLQVRSLVKGQPHEVYYWCDICSIKRFEKINCECCGAPMELKEEPVRQ